jgi:hypothetical protein
MRIQLELFCSCGITFLIAHACAHTEKEERERERERDKEREREREREGDVEQAKKKFTRPFVVVVACLLKIGMCMIDRRIFTFVLVRFDSSN